jgi:hypothetical protein
MRIAKAGVLIEFIAAACTAPLLQAQAGGSAADIQSKLYARFTLTQITADRTDIVTPGSILVLRKNGLQMQGISATMPPTNVYKDGRLLQSAGSLFKGLAGTRDGSDYSTVPKRTFVAGEKFWLTGIRVQQDSVILTVYSDPFNDIRYYAELKFPFPVKKVIPPTDDVMKQVDEVVSVDNAAAAPPPAASAQNTPAMQAIPPPPPPPDQPPAPPKTIAIGQTRAVVIATWGQPTKDIKLATKEILVYADMKVTLVGGKVSDVQ